MKSWFKKAAKGVRFCDFCEYDHRCRRRKTICDKYKENVKVIQRKKTRKLHYPVEDQSSTGLLFFMKSWTDAINNSSSGVNMFYGKATSTGYTNFQIGFYPRVILYNFVWNDNPSDGIALGLQYNLKLNTEIYLWAAWSSQATTWFGQIKFYQSSISINTSTEGIPVYFVIFG